MSFYEKLSEEEINMIEHMRYQGVYDSSSVRGSWVDTKCFLRFWEEAKSSAWMKRVFQDSLILRKKVEAALSSDELYNSMDEVYWSEAFRDVRDRIMFMLAEYQDIYFINGMTSIKDNLRYHMFTVEALIENKYSGQTMELRMPDGNMFKLMNGAKLMKAMGRLAKAANATDAFEEVRLRQSQVMNQARLSTDLCLSIHPLDYITASYNANDWRSCMCWEDGEFRRGVIEMMNSPYVVVAYTESAHEKLNVLWNIDARNYSTWNSKKWREFFIVDPSSGIYGIKGYPYWNRDLEDAALRWLKELFCADFSSALASEITVWQVGEDVPDYPNFRISMHCGPAMYNDFYSGNDYHAFLVQPDEECNTLWLDYSGESECIVCGNSANLYDDFDGEGELVCNSCLPHDYCACCGDRIYNDDDSILFDGRYYCLSCYDGLPQCQVCGEHFDEDNSPDTGITFALSLTDEDNSTVLTSEGVWRDRVEERCVCTQCADTVFIDGRDEVSRRHSVYSTMFAYFPLIPYFRIKPEALSNLYNDEDIAKFLDNGDVKASA